MTSNEHRDHQPDDSDNPFSSSRVWDTWLPYVVRAGNDSFMTSLLVGAHYRLHQATALT